MKLTHILLDMDGVLANFFSPVLEALNQRWNGALTEEQYVQHYKTFDMAQVFDLAPHEFWMTFDGPGFWSNLPLMQNAVELHKRLKELDVPIYVTSSPSMSSTCIYEKTFWLRSHFGIPLTKCMFGSAKHLMAKPGALLIDDFPVNVTRFIHAGGSAALVPSNWNTTNLTFEQIWAPIQTALNH